MNRMWWTLILLLLIAVHVALSKKGGGKIKGWPKSSSGSFNKNYGVSDPYKHKTKIKIKGPGTGRIAAAAAAGAIGGAVVGYGLARLNDPFERMYYRQQHYTTYRSFIMKCYTEKGVPFNIAEFNATVFNSTASNTTAMPVTPPKNEDRYSQQKEVCETTYWKTEARPERMGRRQHSIYEYYDSDYNSAGIFCPNIIVFLSFILMLVT
ncbi:uncharacterized protein LOC122811332 [Protopterus annectens]|uniref:uncharacterized protein LOC122811332 n=1 Tax=Protopterus annectens TaxID=7888 RepID=UPI001CFB72A8|nr:uncharacterized protein LOC122811332 [Protopterus annectens]